MLIYSLCGCRLLSLQRGREEYLPGAGFSLKSRSNLLAEPSAGWAGGWGWWERGSVGGEKRWANMKITQGSECADIENKDWGGGWRRRAGLENLKKKMRKIQRDGGEKLLLQS